MNNSPRRRGLAAPYALPAGFAGMLTIGAVAAALHGRLPAGAVLALAAVVVAVGSMVAEPAVAPLLGGIGWLTSVGFAGPPYGQLRPAGPLALHAVVVMGTCAAAGAAIGLIVRRVASSYTLWIVDVPGDVWPAGAADPGIPAGQPGALQPAAGQPAGPQPDPAGVRVPEPGAAAGLTVAAQAGHGAPDIAPQETPRPGIPAQAITTQGITTQARPAQDITGIGVPENEHAGPGHGMGITGNGAAEHRRRQRAGRMAGQRRWARGRAAPGRQLPSMSGVIGTRRLLAGVLLAAGLPLLTTALVAGRPNLGLADDLLIYLVAVVAIAIVGGFWPAVLGAVTASLLLNWYFTKPLHTLTIAEPRSLLALLLFVTVAVTVSSVVHLAARRAIQAARSGEDAASLLALAQTVLGGADTPAAVLEHLTSIWQGKAELVEQVRGQWVRVSARGSAPESAAVTRVEMRPGLALLVTGQARPLSPRMLDGFAAQAAAALDRDRLRTQAAQSEALAEGNRMRTALLAAVSHDLRTPLASIKASVSTLRQTDVQWTAADEASLLATIEQSADRLDALIGNLLDMSRLSTGSLQPFLRPTAIDEVAPVALRGLDAGINVQLAVPDGLPLVRTDPGLLERVLANLFANALAYSPPGLPPALYARQEGRSVVLDVVDHGRGVPDELKPRMFEPFERLAARNTGTGVGLGLAVVKGFVDTMGGTVTATDTDGGGLTMRVTLPVASRSASSAVAAES
jgi:two-component system sensor histidine kinase KdpD